jgi:conflict system STAND superfamily ATPase
MKTVSRVISVRSLLAGLVTQGSGMQCRGFVGHGKRTAETEFRGCCHEYRDLEEFEDLFREHFHDFLIRQLDQQTGLRKAPRKGHQFESNPFRRLNFFDFEHAALYYGRTKAVWEILDTLKNQAKAKNRFVLVLGPAGSGKSSLVRAGVLPLLTQGGTPVRSGPWRRAVSRPGAGGDRRRSLRYTRLRAA